MKTYEVELEYAVYATVKVEVPDEEDDIDVVEGLAWIKLKEGTEKLAETSAFDLHLARCIKLPEPQLVWNAVGTDETGHASFFYTFSAHEKGQKFIDDASSRIIGVTWDLYPCEIESEDSALDNFISVCKE